MIRKLLIAGAIALLAAPAFAQSVDDVVGALTPPVHDKATLGTGDATLGVKVVERTTEPQALLTLMDKSKAPSISIQINFEFGSSELTPASKSSIDLVASAMNDDRLQSYSFMVAGHTDGKGSDEINDPLSLQRAQAVLDYLSLYDHVNPTRLIPRGFGKRALANAGDPFAAENRRVQFVTLE